jgi:hypothetical protein
MHRYNTAFPPMSIKISLQLAIMIGGSGIYLESEVKC